MGGRRVPAVQHAERINAAADLAGAGVLPAEAARVLAGRFAVSVRQARRYVDQAAAGGRVPVPGAKVVFTVKLPAALPGGCAPMRASITPRSRRWWRGRCRSAWTGAAETGRAARALKAVETQSVFGRMRPAICHWPTRYWCRSGGPAPGGAARKEDHAMTSAAIYARVSSARQAEDETIGSQIQALHEHARAAGLEVPGHWVFEERVIRVRRWCARRWRRCVIWRPRA